MRTSPSPTHLDRLRSVFEEAFGTSNDAVFVRAPGRVNLIGDHTDYNEGFVLPMTIDRAAYVGVSSRADHRVRVYARTFDEGVQYTLSDRPETAPGSWQSYVTGVIEELRHRLPGGVDLLVDGDVPLGAGLSSSAALEVAVAYALDVLFRLGLDPTETARLGQRVEHRYAGVACGIMDQFVSRLGRSESALLLDCRSLAHEYVPFSPRTHGLALVIADSGVRRALAASEYGKRRQECVRAVDVLRKAGASVQSLRDVTTDLLEELRPDLEDILYRRALHVVEENRRTRETASALERKQFEEAGALMTASHESLRDLFDVSCPELNTLASAALRCDGILGARMTGGGFGGCTVNLLRQDALNGFEETLRSTYRREHRRTPTLYVVRDHFQTEQLKGDS